ncbi:SDR family NAD(P)-dependent oxidoreductase [Pantoea rwandensis]|uniref:Short-chain dehydrogenase n=1 Tax=Pantoea rwandensis TaxID=1076550 RepID=A0A1X1D548_9GAMM|nr:SDR family NAD(P)-dependent oxidoreductase [Pantoea rwandensis]ORM71776.1 hypothetical protein HA51_01535 [Pantoea rwandensis]
MAVKNWVVMGVDTGLGRAIALELLESGHRVFALVLDYNKVTDLTSRFKDRFIAEELESYTNHFMRKFMTDLLNVTFIVDGLILCETSALLGSVEETSTSEISKAIESGLTFPILLVRGLISLFRSNRRGRIVYISSSQGEKSQPGASVFSATSYALEHFINSVSDEMSVFGVETSIINIGRNDTPVLTGEMTIANLMSDYDISESHDLISKVLLTKPQEMEMENKWRAKSISDFVSGEMISKRLILN